MLPAAQKEVLVALYNMQGQLISSKSYVVKAGKIQLNLQYNSTGIYIAKVYLDKPVVLKIIKN